MAFPSLPTGFTNIQLRNWQMFNSDPKAFLVASTVIVPDSVFEDTDVLAPAPSGQGQLQLFRTIEGNYHLIGNTIVGTTGIAADTLTTLFDLSSLINEQDEIKTGTYLNVGISQASQMFPLTVEFLNSSRLCKIRTVSDALVSGTKMSFDFTIYVENFFGTEAI